MVERSVAEMRREHPEPDAEHGADDHRGDRQFQRRRQELDDADQPEVERVAGQVVDLPADGDRNDLCGECGEEARRPETQERAVPEGGIALVWCGGIDRGHAGRRSFSGSC